MDSLAATGSTVSSEDHIDAILDGLLEEYNAFITSMTSCIDTYTIEDIEALLLAQEERFEKHMFLERSFIQANVASTNLYSLPFSRSYNNIKRQQSFRKPHTSCTTQSSSTSFTTCVQCQLCYKFGLTTLTCWTRSDNKLTSHVSVNTTFFQPSSKLDH